MVRRRTSSVPTNRTRWWAMVATAALSVTACGMLDGVPPTQTADEHSLAAAPSTTAAVFWFNPSERLAGLPPDALGESASQWWRLITGLSGPRGNDAWHERLSAACAAPIWKHSAAAVLVDDLIKADGGDPDGGANQAGGRSLRADAILALWTMVNNGDWCADAFPPASLSVDLWRNQTGLRGPMDLVVWKARLDQACSIDDEDADSWKSLAAEFIHLDGGNADNPERLRGAVDALQLMLRQRYAEADGPNGEPMPGRSHLIHECSG